MQRFDTSLSEIEKGTEFYLVSGRSDGDEPIAVGDFLNDFEVRRIEAYGHDLFELSPGMSVRLTLSHAHRQTDSFHVSLVEYRFAR